MRSRALRVDTREGVRTLTLDRPERRNALDAELRDALHEALDEAARDSSVMAVVITGADGAFCAGGDLGSFEELHDARVYRHVSHRLTELMDALERLEKPTLAAIDGVATGAGLTLALCCDWRLASPGARLLFREGRLGLVPTHGGVGRLVKLVGLARAKEALLSGDDLDALAALRLGLVHAIEDGDLLAAAHERALRMARRAPLSYGAAKRLLHLAADSDLRSTIAAESLVQTGLLATDDHREGLAAARERREPAFTGR
ncbi:MAG TPA: enoyl-CoA hydratase/isomerase family protein [Solirubrobacteraceae bacterium]|nr:enoyl-CoA hydratase/isomerase family protein [Solirubrobacteraceae bacterium]